MFDRTRKGWALACALGFGALFVGFALTGPVWSFVWPGERPDPTALPSMDPATRFGGLDPEVAAGLYREVLLYHVVHITLFGAVIGWLQTRVLQTPAVRTRWWVLLTALGFSSIFVFEAFRPGIVSGGHPAPFEPLLIGIGGGAFAGLYQWLYLRKKRIGATRWLGLWIAGLGAGAVLGAVALTLLGFLGPFMRSVLSERALFTVGQVVFYLVYGPAVGLMAGLVSGRALLEALPVPAEGGAVGARTAA